MNNASSIDAAKAYTGRKLEANCTAITSLGAAQQKRETWLQIRCICSQQVIINATIGCGSTNRLMALPECG